MRSFTCPVCGHLVFFENTACLHCDTPLGYDPDQRTMVRAGPDDPWVRCANQQVAACNWVLPVPQQGLCRSCALTRTRPADADTEGLVSFATAEAAKRRLVFQLDELGLPVIDRVADPDAGLTFDLLSSAQGPVTTGHADGVVTIDLAESDDAHREQMRQHLDEAYRTMLGHFRHEVGHWYWGVIVERAGLSDEFRRRFGDERQDYGEAIDRHYRNGPPADWSERYVSAYATMHPWEDWAETFAHILHIRDSLQTAAAFGMVVAGPLDERTGRRDPDLAAVPLAETATGHREDFADVIDQWLPLTYALNAVNRSMGYDDLYPFVLAPAVMDKLAWVHERIDEVSRSYEGLSPAR